MVPCYGWYLGCPLSCVHYFAFEGDKVPLNFRDCPSLDKEFPPQVAIQLRCENWLDGSEAKPQADAGPTVIGPIVIGVAIPVAIVGSVIRSVIAIPSMIDSRSDTDGTATQLPPPCQQSAPKAEPSGDEASSAPSLRRNNSTPPRSRHGLPPLGTPRLTGRFA
jgi:hypothetical protein